MEKRCDYSHRLSKKENNPINWYFSGYNTVKIVLKKNKGLNNESEFVAE